MKGLGRVSGTVCKAWKTFHQPRPKVLGIKVSTVFFILVYGHFEYKVSRFSTLLPFVDYWYTKKRFFGHFFFMYEYMLTHQTVIADDRNTLRGQERRKQKKVVTVCSFPHSYPQYVGVFSLSNQTNHFQVYGILFQGIFGFFSISSLFSTRAMLNFHINPYILQPSAMLKEPSDLEMKQTRNCHAFSSHSPVIYFCEVNNWENKGISSWKSENLSNLLSQIISCVLISFYNNPCIQ